MKHSQHDLKQMQSLPLQAKIEMTKRRITQWYEFYNGDVYVSFSGGKDSTVLLNIARKIYPDMEAVFVDTGLEYPEVRKNAISKDNVTVLRPVMNFKQVINKYGYPVVSKEQSQYIHEARTTQSEKLKNIRLNGNKWGMGKVSNKWKYLLDADFKISNKCCDIMKKNPVKKFEKETGKHPILATMCEESSLRKSQWLKDGCNGFTSKRPISKPMSFWTEQDVLRYILDHEIEIPSVYGKIEEAEEIEGQMYFDGFVSRLRLTGVERTGCMFCMYGLHRDCTPNRFQRMKKTHPKQYEYCLKSKDSGGLGIKEVLDYMGLDYD